MLVNATSLPAGKSVSCDICIVGSGPAGIVMATELASNTRSVVLIESGGQYFNKRNQNLSAGEIDAQIYHAPLHLAHRRGIGGTSTVWGGRCVPLDDIDFEYRSYMPYSGWPISKTDLRPYYQKANRVCEAGNFEYNIQEALTENVAEMIPGFVSNVVETNKLERFSRPTNFANYFRSTLTNHPNLTLFFNATCTSIKMHTDGKYVEKVIVKKPDRESVEIDARHFILSMGCLETTRLLLASNDVMPKGIGNHSDLLGRFYMSHIEGFFENLKLNQSVEKIIYGYERSRDGIYCRRRLSFNPNSQHMYRIGNLIARVGRPVIMAPDHRSGILSAIYLTKRFLLPERSRSITAIERHLMDQIKYSNPELYWLHLRNIVTDVPRLVAFSRLWIHKRIFAKRKLPPPVFKSDDNSYPLEFNVEHSPDPNNRITLTDQKDLLGLPKIHLKCAVNDFDRYTIKTAFRLFGEEFEKSGCGRLLLDGLNLDELIDSCTLIQGHNIGTVRMASTSSGGVVDENCQIYGVKNLFVVGSAVFPTSGHANPTLTIVALAKRLADHIKQL